MLRLSVAVGLGGVGTGARNSTGLLRCKTRVLFDNSRDCFLLFAFCVFLSCFLSASLLPSPPQPSDLMDGLEMKPSVLAASLGKRLIPRASRMRRAGIEPNFLRDYRAIAQLTEPQFRVSEKSRPSLPSESRDFCCCCCSSHRLPSSLFAACSLF